jgi:pimeloyl-ACP methyl ester carboxylesterase
MSQLVLIHGPGAGGCAASYRYQMQRFPGALAPDLPGHLKGESFDDVAGYTRWLRDWLHERGQTSGLVLAGFTLGACVALDYALTWPDEVDGLLLMTVAMRPKERAPDSLEFRLNAAKGGEAMQRWLDSMEHMLMFVEPDLTADLMECHKQVGPISQHNDLLTIDRFDARDRIHRLKAPLTLVRGVDDPIKPDEYELEIHEAVPGSRYIKLERAGHFPHCERPDDVNAELAALLGEYLPQ